MEKTYPPQLLESGRIVLKQHVKNLAQDMFQYIEQDRARLAAFFPWVELTQTVADCQTYIGDTLEKWERYEQFDFGLYRQADGLYIGNIGAVRVAWPHERCEIGYWIFSAFEGQGYVSEAVAILETCLFEMGFNRIEIRCAGHNLRSKAVPERLGYDFEGLLRQNEVLYGNRQDTCLYAKLKPYNTA